MGLQSTDQVERWRHSCVQRRGARLAAREEARLRARHAAREQLPRVLARYPAVRAAYLYGSVLRRGAFSASSDLDVGVIGADAATCMQIWREAEEQMREWPLDVRPLENCEFGLRIAAKGELVYERAAQGPEV